MGEELQNNTTLTKLEIECVSDAGGFALGKALKSNRALTTLRCGPLPDGFLSLMRRDDERQKLDEGAGAEVRKSSKQSSKGKKAKKDR